MKRAARKRPKPTTRSGEANEVRSSTMLEAICAFHLASYVRGPVKDRGGLMLVGPPGVLKTSFLDVASDNYHNAYAISNLNTQTLMKMQGELVNGGVRTIILSDMQAMYAGDPRTAARLEQALMQLAGEGSRGASWQDTRHQRFKARCSIFGALTQKFFESHANNWEDTGFLRRFVWSSYTLKDPDVLMNAIERWQRHGMSSISVPVLPGSGEIPDNLTPDDRRVIRSWVKYQPGPHEIQFSLLCRATAALRWHYQEKKIKANALATMAEFARTLHREAALVTL